jgi:alkylation response protein AidB-like acyl-CoA dehydrogenase
MLFEDDEVTEDQRAMRAMARRFAKEHIQPIASQIDGVADPKENFPWDMFKAASRLGLRTLALPEDYGGINADLVTKIVVAQELGYGDVICAKIISQCWKTSQILYDAGTQEQKESFLSDYRDDDTYLISVALTEPDAGSDNLLPYNEPGGGMQLSARKQGDGYVLNGTKHFIANGNVSKLFIVAARTDPGAPVKQGTSFFLVPKDTPGFSVWSVHDKVGFRAYGQVELVLEDVFVPKENLLGGKENVDTVSQAVTPYSKLDIAIHALTLMESAYKTALEYAHIRVQGGKSIIEHQAIASMLADMYISIQAVQGLIRQVVRCTERGDWNPTLAIASKVFASEAAVKLAISAMEVFGGYGVMKETPMEKHVRDALIFLHIDGTNQINRQKICNLLKSQEN